MNRILVQPLFSAGPVPVSTVTPLLPFTALGKYQLLLFSVQNLDPTNAVQVTIETSEDGISVDTQTVYQYTIQPGQQCSLDVGPDQLRSYYSLSGQTSSPSYPTANVSWKLKGGMDASWVT